MSSFLFNLCSSPHQSSSSSSYKLCRNNACNKLVYITILNLMSSLENNRSFNLCNKTKQEINLLLWLVNCRPWQLWRSLASMFFVCSNLPKPTPRYLLVTKMGHIEQGGKWLGIGTYSHPMEHLGTFEGTDGNTRDSLFCCETLNAAVGPMSFWAPAACPLNDELGQPKKSAGKSIEKI